MIDIEQTTSFGDLQVVWTGGVETAAEPSLTLVDAYEG